MDYVFDPESPSVQEFDPPTLLIIRQTRNLIHELPSSWPHPAALGGRRLSSQRLRASKVAKGASTYVSAAESLGS